RQRNFHHVVERFEMANRGYAALPSVHADWDFTDFQLVARAPEERFGFRIIVGVALREQFPCLRAGAAEAAGRVGDFHAGKRADEPRKKTNAQAAREGRLKT